MRRVSALAHETVDERRREPVDARLGTHATHSLATTGVHRGHALREQRAQRRLAARARARADAAQRLARADARAACRHFVAAELGERVRERIVDSRRRRARRTMRWPRSRARAAIVGRLPPTASRCARTRAARHGVGVQLHARRRARVDLEDVQRAAIGDEVQAREAAQLELGHETRQHRVDPGPRARCLHRPDRAGVHERPVAGRLDELLVDPDDDGPRAVRKEQRGHRRAGPASAASSCRARRPRARVARARRRSRPRASRASPAARPAARRRSRDARCRADPARRRRCAARGRGVPARAPCRCRAGHRRRRPAARVRPRSRRPAPSR